MKVGFVFQKDSHFKSVYLTYKRLSKENGIEPVFYGLNSSNKESLTDFAQIPIIWLDDESLQQALSIFNDCQILVCCLGGYLLNKIIHPLKYTNIKVVSLFPGIVSRFQIDAFITRMNADEVWLNSPFDYRLYGATCHAFGVANNGRLYGMSWIDHTLQLSKMEQDEHRVIFFEQTQILDTIAKRQKFEQKLTNLINTNLEVIFIYKTRKNTDDAYFADFRKKLSKKPNVIVVDRLSDKMANEASMYISISSSAIIEGLLFGKYCSLLEKGLCDNDSLEFYQQSGLFLESDKLSKKTVNQQWLNDRVLLPKESLNLVTIDKKNQYMGIKDSPTLAKLAIKVAQISLYSRQNLLPLLKKRQLINIRRALKYLNG